MKKLLIFSVAIGLFFGEALNAMDLEKIKKATIDSAKVHCLNVVPKILVSGNAIEIVKEINGKCRIPYEEDLTVGVLISLFQQICGTAKYSEKIAFEANFIHGMLCHHSDLFLKFQSEKDANLARYIASEILKSLDTQKVKKSLSLTMEKLNSSEDD